MIDFKIINGKKIDFNIFKSENGNRSLSLPRTHYKFINYEYKI